MKQLLNWINPNEKYRVNLLYDASIEENTNKDFHKYCDGKGATITLVESSKGKRFGGYTRITIKPIFIYIYLYILIFIKIKKFIFNMNII